MNKSTSLYKGKLGKRGSDIKLLAIDRFLKQSILSYSKNIKDIRFVEKKTTDNKPVMIHKCILGGNTSSTITRKATLAFEATDGLVYLKPIQ